MIFWSDDPLRDAGLYIREQEKQTREKCTYCEVCQEPIWDEKAFHFGDEWVHKECLAEYWDDEYEEVPYGFET